MKRIVILGSTGSICTQTLDVVRRLRNQFEIVGLVANNNVSLLAQQAVEFAVPNVCVVNESKFGELRASLNANSNLHISAGIAGMCEIAALPNADVVVVAVAGAIGIAPTHAALHAGKDIALASKEVLVAAGEVTMNLAREKNARILPIDSEHSAMFQCLQGAPDKSIERLLLTASGGPFRTFPKEALATVTPEQALKHPTWTMGGLVTINSATLMNKALEMMEARWLFDVPIDDVEVVVHPQSIIHSMVRFRDGSTLAQLGLPDMRLPIQYALVYPERIDSELPRMPLSAYANLTFEAPDEDKFPALNLARRASKTGGTLPAVMNAANEEAVDLFLNHKLSYLGMGEKIAQAMDAHNSVAPTLDNILNADTWAREFVQASVAF